MLLFHTFRSLRNGLMNPARCYASGIVRRDMSGEFVPVVGSC